MLLILSIACSD